MHIRMTLSDFQTYSRPYMHYPVGSDLAIWSVREYGVFARPTRVIEGKKKKVLNLDSMSNENNVSCEDKDFWEALGETYYCAYSIRTHIRVLKSFA